MKMLRAATTDNQRSTLLRIAPELRNCIYQYTMPNDSSIYLAAHAFRILPTTSVGPSHIHFNPPLPLLASLCRQIRDEYPLQDYYSINKFVPNPAMT